MENYFSHFGLPQQYKIDKTVLRQVYLQKSRELHPDFHTMASPFQQEEALRLSTLYNQGFSVLNDDLKRLYHLFELNGLTESSPELPKAFLMEMMELNELLLENPEAGQRTLANKKLALTQQLNQLMLDYDNGEHSKLSEAYLLYLQQKYLLRATENFTNLAS